MDKLLFENVNFHDALRISLRDIRSTASEGTGRTPAFLFYCREFRGSFHYLGIENVIKCYKNVTKMNIKNVM